MKLKLDFNKLIEIKKLWQGNLNVVYLHNHKKQLGSTYICSSIPCETFCAPTIGYTGRVLAERGHLAVRGYRNRNILLYFMFSFQVTCGHSKSLFIVEIPLVPPLQLLIFFTQECLANCIDQSYDVKITSAAYPNHLVFIESSEFCIIYNKLLKSCQTEKKITLEEQYPNMCKILQQNGTNCNQVN